MLKYVLAAIVLAVSAQLGAAEASEHTVRLTYATPATAQQGEATIVFGEVTNSREPDERRLGAIRDQYGAPSKILLTREPIHEIVGQAFRDGLAGRGLSAATGPHRLDLNVTRFDCNQYFAREAHIIVILTLVDTHSGATLFQETYQAHQNEGAFFVRVEPLRAMANAAMQAVVDQALDDPEFRAALTTVAPVHEGVTPPAAAVN